MNITEYAIFKKMAGGSGGGGEGEADSALDAFIMKTITEVTSNATEVAMYAFYNQMKLERVYLPEATRIDAYAFEGTSALAHLYAPKVSTLYGNSDFRYSGIVEIYLPEVTRVNGSTSFSDCSKLKKLVLPKLVGNGANYCLSTSTVSLEHFEVGYLSNMPTTFSQYPGFKTLIFRAETFVPAYISTFFDRCVHFTGTVDATHNPEGLRDGHIYVAASLIDQYKAATNWAQYADLFRALEDYTVDGTITGELDWDKINKVVINFTIDGTSYQADEGMTWTDWCGSSYNTAGYVASSSDQSVIAPSGNSIMDAGSWSVVNKSATITNGHAYATYNADSGGAN